jgi:hypothetical protein
MEGVVRFETCQEPSEPARLSGEAQASLSVPKGVTHKRAAIYSLTRIHVSLKVPKVPVMTRRDRARWLHGQG